MAHFCGESPVGEETTPTTSADSVGAPHSAVRKTDGMTPATAQAEKMANESADLAALNAQKQAFSLSSLAKTAAHTVLGVGACGAEVMCILEMPDADSDKAGNLLMGAQGEQLSKMMVAIRLEAGKDVYVTALSPWRTPGNRALTSAESALFLPFLKREIQLVCPKKILIFGAGVASALIGTPSLAKARGSWHEWENIPVRVTLPISALKATAQRQQAWDDLKALQALEK